MPKANHDHDHSGMKKYQRVDPRKSSLYQAVQQHLAEHRSSLSERGANQARFIANTFKGYLRCGLLEYGFARLYCQSCQHSRLIAFSCKQRGICPRCAGRRMSQSAIRQESEVFPVVPTRQWVLTLPQQLRTLIAYKSELMTELIELWITSLRYFYQQRCLPNHPHPPQNYSPDELNTYYSPFHPHDIGALTSIQRHTDALSLFPHLHTITTDGILYSDEHLGDSTLNTHKPYTKHPKYLKFIPIDVFNIEDDDLIEILILFRYRLILRLERRGYLYTHNPEAPRHERTYTLTWGEEDPRCDESQSALLDTYLASSKMVRAFGASAGAPLTFDFGEPPTPTIHGHLNVSINGFGLHAATEVEADDRDRLIKLCRYVQRPTLAADRLNRLMMDVFITPLNGCGRMVRRESILMAQI